MELVHQLGIKGDNPPPPDPQAERLQHTWGVDFYTIVIESTAIVLVILYTYVFVKVYQGTKYPFILFLIVLFIVSNLCVGLMAFFCHYTSILAQDSSTLTK